MNSSTATIKTKCAREKIAAYLDGELAPRAEISLEKHFTGCRDCRAELNLQKRMFALLDSAFDEKAEIELPENFARIVATRAETNVKGLRSKDERFRALFLSAALLLIAVAGLGADTGDVFASFGKFGEQTMTVVSFAAHLLYDLTIGITVIFRSLGNQPGFDSAVGLTLAIGVIALSAKIYFRYISESRRF